MKHLLLISILVFFSFVGPVQAAQETAEDTESNLKLTELASLTEGLVVTHNPDPVLYITHAPSISGIQWQHSTTVSSSVGPVTILEFGFFVERNGQWEIPYGIEVSSSHTSEDFAKDYDCPNSELVSGYSYTNEWNRSIIDCVPEQMVKWYFIGLDDTGKRVKGEANLKVISKFAEKEVGSF